MREPRSYVIRGKPKRAILRFVLVAHRPLRVASDTSVTMPPHNLFVERKRNRNRQANLPVCHAMGQIKIGKFTFQGTMHITKVQIVETFLVICWSLNKCVNIAVLRRQNKMLVRQAGGLPDQRMWVTE